MIEKSKPKYNFYGEKLPETPCDLCIYDPPSSKDGKPCTMCPAQAKESINQSVKFQNLKDKMINTYCAHCKNELVCNHNLPRMVICNSIMNDKEFDDFSLLYDIGFK